MGLISSGSFGARLRWGLCDLDGGGFGRFAANGRWNMLRCLTDKGNWSSGGYWKEGRKGRWIVTVRAGHGYCFLMGGY